MSTKAQVRREAHARLRLGYFAPPFQPPYVTCPRCRGDVHAYPMAWDKAPVIARLLEAALVKHWEDCDG